MKAQLYQQQQLKISQRQVQRLHLLQMNETELRSYIQTISLENPLIELTEEIRTSHAETGSDPAPVTAERHVPDNMAGSFIHDNKQDAYLRIGDAGGLEESLQNHLRWQINSLDLSKKETLLLKRLVGCLDEQGYLRMTTGEISRELSVSEEEAAAAVSRLKAMEPAGVGAADLSECLVLQLERLHAPETAVTIAERFLPDLARNHYRHIAAKLGVSLSEVLQARDAIHALNPRPGTGYVTAEKTVYIQPDVFVDLIDGKYVLRERDDRGRWFSVNAYYCDLLNKTDDPEVKTYLQQKLKQAKALREDILQRGSTLQNCCRYLVDYQQEFFFKGVSSLKPLTMGDVAESLSVHISTVSRTVKDKYLQYPGGTVPLSLFFAHSASAEKTYSTGEHSESAVKTAIKQLIEHETKTHPLSDQSIVDELKNTGISIARRTVAKYRDEMGIPSASGRKSR